MNYNYKICPLCNYSRKQPTFPVKLGEIIAKSGIENTFNGVGCFINNDDHYIKTGLI